MPGQFGSNFASPSVVFHPTGVLVKLRRTCRIDKLAQSGRLSRNETPRSRKPGSEGQDGDTSIRYTYGRFAARQKGRDALTKLKSIDIKIKIKRVVGVMPDIFPSLPCSSIGMDNKVQPPVPQSW